MSEFYDDDPPVEDRTVTLKRSQIKTLEEKAKRTEAAEAEKNALARELAFLKAGIPADHPVTPYFVKGYDGELTADAIKAAAVVAGIVNPDVVSTPDLDAIARMNQAAGGATTTPNTEAELAAKLAAARTPEEFDRIYAEAGGKIA